MPDSRLFVSQQVTTLAPSCQNTTGNDSNPRGTLPRSNGSRRPQLEAGGPLSEPGRAYVGASPLEEGPTIQMVPQSVTSRCRTLAACATPAAFSRRQECTLMSASPPNVVWVVQGPSARTRRSVRERHGRPAILVSPAGGPKMHTNVARHVKAQSLQFEPSLNPNQHTTHHNLNQKLLNRHQKSSETKSGYPSTAVERWSQRS